MLCAGSQRFVAAPYILHSEHSNQDAPVGQYDEAQWPKQYHNTQAYSSGPLQRVVVTSQSKYRSVVTEIAVHLHRVTETQPYHY